MKRILILSLMMLFLTMTSLLSVPADDNRHKGDAAREEKKPDVKVTFVELGSVRCIPCKKMQPIMKEIEEEYGDQVKVIFYDVRTPEGRPYAYQYRIRVIPTQVFLDKDGNEYFRHQGFFPKEELVKVLKQQGVKEVK